jgi:hypothetical protein
MYEHLMEAVVGEENCRKALGAVERNRGAAGIDRMKTTELEAHLKAHWEKIRAKLLAGTYVPSPVRRVEIPKPSGGTRMLGIPTVLDRFIQQLLLQAMTPIWEPMFSEHSYGFRPGRRAHDAVVAAQRYAQEGKDWVVDIDIAKFFDHVNHDILMGRIGAVIRDKRVLGLLGKYLRLQVNTAKSGTGRVWERKFLGFRLNREWQIGAAPESIERFKAKVREMWRSCQSRTSNQLRDAWQRYVRGWWGYYRLAEDRKPIFRLEGWIRRHIRKCFWLRWHNGRGRANALRRLGVHPRLLQTVHTGRGAWFMAKNSTVNAGLKTCVLRRYGFLMPSDLAAITSR